MFIEFENCRWKLNTKTTKNKNENRLRDIEQLGANRKITHIQKQFGSITILSRHLLSSPEKISRVHKHTHRLFRRHTILVCSAFAFD